jgi:hypothetical protein
VGCAVPDPLRAGPEGQPVVLFGGFLTNPLLMRGIRLAMADVTGQRIFLVPARSHDWMLGVSRAGRARLLRFLHQTVQSAIAVSATGKVTLVGHSAAGVVSRQYLSPEAFAGTAYAGHRFVDHLITLGSPHVSDSIYGGRGSQWVGERYPGAFFSPEVRYTCVVGKHVQGSARGSLRARTAFRSYGFLTGHSADWGDGCVPLSSALLGGTRHVIVDGAAHFWGLWGFRVPWYGSPECIADWWPAAWLDEEPQPLCSSDALPARRPPGADAPGR